MKFKSFSLFICNDTNSRSEKHGIHTACRSDSRSILRKQFNPKDGIMGTAIIRGFSLISYDRDPVRSTDVSRLNSVQRRLSDITTVHARLD